MAPAGETASKTPGGLAGEAAALWRARLVRPLSERENAVYEIALPAGRRAALRLHRQGYQTPAAIRSELWWCRALAQAALPVPQPVALADGALTAQLRNGRLVSVVEWVDGTPLGAANVPLAAPLEAQLARHHALGQLLAKIHAVSDRLTLPDWFDRHRWDGPGLTGAQPTWGRFWEHPLLTQEQARQLRQARDWLRATLAAYEAGGADLGLIHADALRENVMIHPASDVGKRQLALTLIDFDDAGFGYRLYDLGSVLSQNLDEPAYPQIRAALIAGYASLRPLREDLVDAFTLARTLASVGWTIARLDPANPVIARHIARALDCARRVISRR
jgi:Ser/Thr protein kinase RdoA (MazF antagonist)